MQSQDSPVQRLIRENAIMRYAVDTWEAHRCAVDAPANIQLRRSVRGIREYDTWGEWSLPALSTAARIPTEVGPASSYYTRPAPILGRRELQEGTLVVASGMGRREVGLRMLHAAGGRPDCSVEGELIPYGFPRRCSSVQLRVAGALNDCTWVGLKEQQFIEQQGIGTSNMLQQEEVGARRLGHLYVLISYLRDPSGEVRMKCEYLETVAVMGCRCLPETQRLRMP